MVTPVTRNILMGSTILGLFFLLSGPVWTAGNEGLSADSFVYDHHGRRDPFWPLVNPAGTVINYDTDYMFTDLVLEGIMMGADGNSIAIINGNVVSAGDQVGDFSIKDIKTYSVTVKKGDKVFELKLKKED